MNTLENIQRTGKMRRIRIKCWERVKAFEKGCRKPKTLDQAMDFAKKSYCLRKRLSKVSSLRKKSVYTHALLVDVWGKKRFLKVGSLVKLMDVVEHDFTVRTAGYEVIRLIDKEEI